jgi:hypothetical protein
MKYFLQAKILTWTSQIRSRNINHSAMTSGGKVLQKFNLSFLLYVI